MERGQCGLHILITDTVTVTTSRSRYFALYPNGLYPFLICEPKEILLPLKIKTDIMRISDWRILLAIGIKLKGRCGEILPIKVTVYHNRYLF